MFLMKSKAWMKVHTAPTAAKTVTFSHSKRRVYLSVRTKFFMATAFAAAWFAVSFWLAQPWISDLSLVVGKAAAFLIIFFIALLPGFLNAHMVMSVVLDKPRPVPLDIDFPAISLLIAAYNEEKSISGTLQAIRGQDYPAPIEILVVDDGSTDKTAKLVRAANMPNLRIIHGFHGGKAAALNQGL